MSMDDLSKSNLTGVKRQEAGLWSTMERALSAVMWTWVQIQFFYLITLGR